MSAAESAGFGPRRTRRPLVDHLAVRFPAAAGFVARKIFDLPAGRLRRAALTRLLSHSYAAYDRMDAAVSFSALAEDVEWHLPPDLPGAADVLHGRDAVMRWYEEFTADWDHRLRMDRFEDHGGGRLSVHAINLMTSRATGLSFEVRDVDELQFRRGRLVLVRERLDDGQGNPWRGLASSARGEPEARDLSR